MSITLSRAVFVVAALLAGCQAAPTDWRGGYPPQWWVAAPREGAPGWEILPQEAGVGEVIVSKRGELGVLSNFAATPFSYHGKTYASVEGFWQAMKYPEATVDGVADPRADAPGARWENTRAAVEQMVGFDAKHAGSAADEVMKSLGITWVSFEGRKMEYRPAVAGEHYRLIVEAMRAKADQNAEVRRVLLATGNLVLRPDHKQEPGAGKAWDYCGIWMEIRAELRQ